MALTCPVMAFCLLLGEMDPSADQLNALEVTDRGEGSVGSYLESVKGIHDQDSGDLRRSQGWGNTEAGRNMARNY